MNTLTGTLDNEPENEYTKYRREYKRLMQAVVTDIRSAMRLRGKIIR